MNEASKVSSVMRRSLRAAVVVLSGLLGASCVDSVPTYTYTQNGRLQISVRATGGDLDLDGYDVVVDSRARFTLRAAPDSDVARVSAGFELAPGTYDVSLDRVDANCAVEGTKSRKVSITAGAATVLAFDVVCAVTGISVTTRTTGTDTPGSYRLQLRNGGPSLIDRIVTSTDSVLMSRLPTGSYTVTLLVPEYCRVTGPSDVPVTVIAGTIAAVPFVVTCDIAARSPRIAYVVGTTAQDGTTESSIEMVSLDGSRRIPLTSGDSPAWSPDGKQLAFSRTECSWYDYGPCPNFIAVMVPELGMAIRPTAGYGGLLPAWAPAGDVIAFPLPDSGASAFFTMGWDGSSRAPLKLEFARTGRVAWSPDGRRIAYTCATAISTSGACVANRDGTGATRLTDGAVTYADPAWSPDGKSIALTRNPSRIPLEVVGGGPEIVVLKLDDHSIMRLSDGSAPAWSPDGTKLVFDGGNGLFIMSADGSNRARLTTGPHHAPAWRP